MIKSTLPELMQTPIQSTLLIDVEQVRTMTDKKNIVDPPPDPHNNYRSQTQGGRCYKRKRTECEPPINDQTTINGDCSKHGGYYKRKRTEPKSTTDIKSITENNSTTDIDIKSTTEIDIKSNRRVYLQSGQAIDIIRTILTNPVLTIEAIQQVEVLLQVIRPLSPGLRKTTFEMLVLSESQKPVVELRMRKLLRTQSSLTYDDYLRILCELFIDKGETFNKCRNFRLWGCVTNKASQVTAFYHYDRLQAMVQWIINYKHTNKANHAQTLWLQHGGADCGYLMLELRRFIHFIMDIPPHTRSSVIDCFVGFVKTFTEANPIDWGWVDELGETLLMVAASPPYYSITSNIFRTILTNCNPLAINTQDRNGRTVLMRLCESGCMQSAVNQLIEHRVDVNLSDYSGITPLWAATYRRDLDLIKLLVRSNANARTTNALGLTCKQWWATNCPGNNF
jgi:hypothetical protein